MVDISEKSETARRAAAAGRFETTAEVIGLLAADGLPKGDALATARIAAIMGAKKTPELVPLCHPIPLAGVTVEFDLGDTYIDVTASIKTTGRTGAEMEALTAVAVAGLTLHDMVKAVDPGATMNNVRVVFKEGGKTGRWERP
ncbi:cyclic pyranopterin monophosphate synthase MoaC [Hoyosella sp. YIM 151337]|uniref:cyclic pyranopterin monophosphate synthase MoaC n=1 Tax=Hoyosella sp. YIM 151337 TaxID=2992742 RepID=UPI0022364440|nr:cyclic pyranopterin monophosphate synthase MoaC [Hoyosella sp. YIM 151337]MCW4356030.1 cyclic pyranopterin monophosphate synthase MoaC [Hoyosella sp. YIM 151337]